MQLMSFYGSRIDNIHNNDRNKKRPWLVIAQGRFSNKY
ncbi:hypothetical protein J633_1108 [Acinetobacter sp. 216872]|nr:hypothetical protein J633_1108 [Acinetobacter sp. 216872]